MQAADPPVGGIVIETVKHAIEDKGFVVCLIPEGLAKPHRAEFVENKPYLVRMGDSSVVPSPSLLRSLFFPQPRKDLAVKVTSQWARRNIVEPTSLRTSIQVVLRNNGDTSAQDVVVKLVTNTPSEFASAQENVRNVRGEGSGMEFTCQLYETLHPGTGVSVCEVVSIDRELRLAVAVYQTDCRALGVWIDIDPIHTPDGEVKLTPFDGRFPE